MTDDKTKRGLQDRSKINLSEDFEVRYWSAKFGVSKETLTAAVKKVGSGVMAVEDELKSRS